jgi:L-ribulose-5-phosphate 3-epimerase
LISHSSRIINMKIGFISANLVARALKYDGDHDWGKHDRATRDGFGLGDTRLWISDLPKLGFEGVSVWTAHCYYHDPAGDQAAKVREIAAGYNLPIYSYAGSFAQPDPQVAGNWRRTFAVAKELGASCICGGYGPPDAQPIIRAMSNQFGLKFAFENHPHEKSADDILRQIAGFEDCMGVAFDTGWAGTCGFNAPETIRKLGKKRLLEVHLKDVRAAGAHDTCALGDGIVGIQACVEALQEIGYDGWLSIEHEPYDRDPSDELARSVERLKKWLGQST